MAGAGSSIRAVLHGNSREVLELIRQPAGWSEVNRTLGVGSAVNDLVQLDASGLPAVSGERLTRVYTRLPRCTVYHQYDGQEYKNNSGDTSSGAWEFYRDTPVQRGESLLVS